MSAIDTVLARLDRPRQVRPSQWMSACPCCQSRKGRPLAVTEASEGRVLMHAFCGCTTESVLAALGLTVGELFEKPLAHALPATRAKVPAHAILEALSAEVTFLALIASDMLERRTISDPDWARLVTASERIGAARAHV